MGETTRPLRKIIAVASATLSVVLLASWLVTVTASRGRALGTNSEFDQLADLEKRIDNLENGELFTVVDPLGTPRFSISSQTVSVYNQKGIPLAFMGGTADGGFLEARAADGSSRVVLNATTGLTVMERVAETKTEADVTRPVIRDLARIELGKGKDGNYSLRFPAKPEPVKPGEPEKPGNPIAGIGESRAGSGAIIIGDPEGKKKAAILVGTDGKGLMGIYNADGNPIAMFGEAFGNTGGALVLGDAKSEPRVQMGSKDNRYGVVMALPRGFPYVPKSGLTGSYMLGCAAGPACVP